MKGTIHIEISKSYIKGFYKVRIGDIAGAIEFINITKAHVLREIESAMNNGRK